MCFIEDVSGNAKRLEFVKPPLPDGIERPLLKCVAQRILQSRPVVVLQRTPLPHPLPRLLDKDRQRLDHPPVKPILTVRERRKVLSVLPELRRVYYPKERQPPPKVDRLEVLNERLRHGEQLVGVHKRTLQPARLPPRQLLQQQKPVHTHLEEHLFHHRQLQQLGKLVPVIRPQLQQRRVTGNVEKPEVKPVGVQLQPYQRVVNAVLRTLLHPALPPVVRVYLTRAVANKDEDAVKKVRGTGVLVRGTGQLLLKGPTSPCIPDKRRQLLEVGVEQEVEDLVARVAPNTVQRYQPTEPFHRLRYLAVVHKVNNITVTETAKT